MKRYIRSSNDSKGSIMYITKDLTAIQDLPQSYKSAAMDYCKTLPDTFNTHGVPVVIDFDLKVEVLPDIPYWFHKEYVERFEDKFGYSPRYIVTSGINVKVRQDWNWSVFEFKPGVFDPNIVSGKVEGAALIGEDGDYMLIADVSKGLSGIEKDCEYVVSSGVGHFSSYGEAKEAAKSLNARFKKSSKSSSLSTKFYIGKNIKSSGSNFIIDVSTILKDLKSFLKTSLEIEGVYKVRVASIEEDLSDFSDTSTEGSAVSYIINLVSDFSETDAELTYEISDGEFACLQVDVYDNDDDAAAIASMLSGN